MPEAVLCVRNVSCTALELYDLIPKTASVSAELIESLLKSWSLSVRDGDQIRFVERAVFALFFVKRV